MKSKNNLIDQNIFRLAKSIKKLSVKALRSYKPEVNDIIETGCADRNRIEHLLDCMLDFCWDEKMLGLYKKLCRYYYGLDQCAAVRYAYAYRDLWDTDECGVKR